MKSESLVFLMGQPLSVPARLVRHSTRHYHALASDSFDQGTASLLSASAAPWPRPSKVTSPAKAVEVWPASFVADPPIARNAAVLVGISESTALAFRSVFWSSGQTTDTPRRVGLLLLPAVSKGRPAQVQPPRGICAALGHKQTPTAVDPPA